MSTTLTTAETTVAELAAAAPASIRVFESFGIDYCCGGKRSLSEACAKANITVDRLEAAIANAERPAEEIDWRTATLAAVINEIVERHHNYVRTEIPRIHLMLAKVAARHGATHPETLEVERLFNALGEELTMHLMKEEQILFPYIAGLELAGHAPASCFGTITRPIAQMVAEHEDAGAILEQLRTITGGYTPPADACTTFKASYQGLAEFERDLHLHIHLENNILFPRAIALEGAS